MEQNKLDITQLIGFLFLIAAFIWLFMFQPEIEEFDQVDTTTSQEISPSEAVSYTHLTLPTKA